MNEQISIDEILKPMRSNDIVVAIRPAIDMVLEAYNMSPRHVAVRQLQEEDKKQKGYKTIGYSIGFSIAPSQLGNASAAATEARSSIFCRIKDQVRVTYIEFPENRQKFYEGIGEVIEKGAANKQYRRINLDILPNIDSIAQAICADMEDSLKSFPSDFACCHLYKKCSVAGKCISQDQDLAVGCYYKRNLKAGKVFYKTDIPSLIPPATPQLQRFADDEEKLKYFREWKLVSPKAKELVPVLYCGHYTDSAILCEVIGHTWEQTAVISINGQMHCIDGTYLAELQPKFKILPRKVMPHSVFLADYVVFDFETTGLNKNDSIIEICAIRYSFNQKKDKYVTFVKNETPINPMATKVNHITEEMLQDAPSFADVTEQFLRFIGHSPLVGHNTARFDIPFFQRISGKTLDNPYCDTYLLSKEAFPEFKEHNLPYLSDALALSTKPSHRAQQDVEATAELFWKCISRVSAPSDENSQGD